MIRWTRLSINSQTNVLEAHFLTVTPLLQCKHTSRLIWTTMELKMWCFWTLQMCGTRLLGWEGRGPGTHHHSWQGHVHGHPVQGKHTHKDSVAAAFQRPVFGFLNMMVSTCCPLLVCYYYTCCYLSYSKFIIFFLHFHFVICYFSFLSSNRMSSKPLRRQRLLLQTFQLFYPLKTIAGVCKTVQHG